MNTHNQIMAMPKDVREKLLDSLDALSEQDLEHNYRESLNEVYATVSIAGLEYDTAGALEAVDPVAYRCGFADYIAADDALTEIDGYYYRTPDLEQAIEQANGDNQ